MDSESQITVNKPISFDLKSETELLAEFTASQKGQPAAIRYEAYRNYMDRRFSSDAVARQIADICAMYTSIYLYTPEEIQVMIGTGSITQEDAVKATFVFDAVTTLYYVENYDIMTNDFDAINAELDRILAPKLEMSKVVVMDDVNTDEFNTAEAVDVELQAKAALKGSVGGVQGILQIQKSVSDGFTDYNAALGILDLIYGISDADARRILGTPKITTSPVNNNDSNNDSNDDSNDDSI